MAESLAERRQHPRAADRERRSPAQEEPWTPEPGFSGSGGTCTLRCQLKTSHGAVSICLVPAWACVCKVQMSHARKSVTAPSEKRHAAKQGSQANTTRLRTPRSQRSRQEGSLSYNPIYSRGGQRTSAVPGRATAESYTVLPSARGLSMPPPTSLFGASGSRSHPSGLLRKAPVQPQKALFSPGLIRAGQSQPPCLVLPSAGNQWKSYAIPAGQKEAQGFLGRARRLP